MKVVNGSAKRIKISLEKVDFATLDSSLVTNILILLPPTDLVNAGLASRRFGLIQDGRLRSLANEAARQLFLGTSTADERSALPQYDGESDIARLHQLYLLRAQLLFSQLIGKQIRYASAESKSSVSKKGYGGDSCALSDHVMRRGRHFAKFIISREKYGVYLIHVGVIRPLPGWDKKELDEFDPIHVNSYHSISRELLAERTERWGANNVNSCSYRCRDGRCWSSSWVDYDNEVWEGQELLDEDRTVGLLLDLDDGTLSLYKNGRRLGVMKSGLSGEYCWYTSMGGVDDTMAIERGALL